MKYLFCIFIKNNKTRDAGYGIRNTASFLLRYTIFSFKIHDTASFLLRYTIRHLFF